MHILVIETPVLPCASRTLVTLPVVFQYHRIIKLTPRFHYKAYPHPIVQNDICRKIAPFLPFSSPWATGAITFPCTSASSLPKSTIPKRSPSLPSQLHSFQYGRVPRQIEHCSVSQSKDDILLPAHHLLPFLHISIARSLVYF